MAKRKPPPLLSTRKLDGAVYRKTFSGTAAEASRYAAGARKSGGVAVRTVKHSGGTSVYLGPKRKRRKKK